MIKFLSDGSAQWNEFDVYFYVILHWLFSKVSRVSDSTERQKVPETKVLSEFIFAGGVFSLCFHVAVFQWQLGEPEDKTWESAEVLKTGDPGSCPGSATYYLRELGPVT